MDYDNAEIPELKNSKYSSGINIIKRIDDLWRDTHRHARNGQFYNWNADLDRIWLELARDLSEKSKDVEKKYTDVKKKFDEVEGELNKLGNFNDNMGQSFNAPDKTMIKNRNDQYKKLMEKQLFLARLENVLGKGTTHEDDDDEVD